MEVENLHQTAIPVGFGWHPYFRLDDYANQHKLQIPACEKVDINDRMIPTGERSAFETFKTLNLTADTVLDNCFKSDKTSGTYQLKLQGKLGTLTMKAPAAQFPFFQVFTPPHRESIALEPMTCNVDAFNNREGLVALAPDQIWKGKMSVEYKQG